jgi:amino acid permease
VILVPPARLLVYKLNSKMKVNSISNFMSVVGFLNGMIGGTILLLPLLGIKSGYLGSSLICLVVGVAQFYSCYLLVTHIGTSSSFKTTVLDHFGNDYRFVKLYSFVSWFSFIPLFFIYFRLIVLQFNGLVG